MDHCADSLPRLRLAEMAAAGADVRPQLRLLMLAEGLAAQPTRRALDLNAETAALCAAANESVRRRAGWLYFVPAPAPLPVTLPRSLWQTAVLCVLRSALPAGRAVVTLHAGHGAAVAVFRVQGVLPGSVPGDTLPLLRRAAALTGGLCVTAGAGCDPARCGADAAGSSPHFAAALRLPLAPRPPLREPPSAGALLQDRYSPLHVLLDGFTV